MIKIDMDMPTDCSYCPLLQTHIAFNFNNLKKYYYCGFSKKDIYNFAERAKSCPLIEVKDGDGK